MEQEWLVTTLPHHGKFVTSITAENVKDIFEVRRELEGLAVELATPFLFQDDLEELEQFFLTAKARIEGDNMAASFYYESDSRLHELIIRKVPNEWLARLLRSLNDHIHRIRTFSASEPGSHT